MNVMVPAAERLYADPTTSMQVVPEALHRGGVASGARSGASSACSGRMDLDWVPDQEAPVVPRLQRRLCRSCPLRLTCLTRALQTQSVGYWAGTTTADRKALAGAGDLQLVDLDARQDELARTLAAAAAAERAQALHPAGEGRLRWYRRGCRCSECRSANTSLRAAERARTSSREKVAA